MKILAIRGKNLASLEGDFEIDFTCEPLRSAGIFAITGPTGSGKSTLLDALCLALFDATPRNNKSSDGVSITDVKEEKISQTDCRNILRRGSADGYAEVDFVALNGDAHRSRWSVRRSREKVDGKLQGTIISLHNMKTNTEQQGTKTELLRQISNIIGLNFDQFTRTVLLAQGDFATFLKAGKNEKADLLEKLTGTDIYSRISSSIYERSKSAEQDLTLLNERIKDIELLSDDDFEVFSSEHTIINADIELLKAQNTELTTKIKWIIHEEVLNANIQQAVQLLQSAQTTVAQAKPRLDYLSQIDSIQEIRDDYTELKNAEKQLSSNQISLSKQKTSREKNELLLMQATNKVIACEEEKAEYTKLLASIPPLIIEARALDINITAAENLRKQANAEWKDSEKSYANSTITIETKEKALKRQTERLEQLRMEQIDLQTIVPVEVITLRENLQKNKPCSVCGSTIHPYKNIETTESQLEIKDIARLWEQNIKNYKQSEQTIANLQGELSVERQKLAEATASLSEKAQKVKSSEEELANLIAQRKCILGGKNANDVEKELANKGQEIADKLSFLTTQKSELSATQEKLTGIISQITKDNSTLHERCCHITSSVNAWIASQDKTITIEQITELLSKDSKWIANERETLNKLRDNTTTAQATLSERQKTLEQHYNAEIKPSLQENKQELQSLLANQNLQVEQKIKRHTEISILLNNHTRGKERLKMYAKELEEKSALAENWKKLNDLLGSADGTKFKVLAQGYTLDALLSYANKHLQALSKRYNLQRIPDSLALQVVDLDMLGEMRTVHSLSGGESFLISLALALGLSSLSSNSMKVESLFIDEGFGSLDVDTLRVAMDALENLQTQGRKIGVISHVAEMTERITTQIQVIKTVNGRSRINIAH